MLEGRENTMTELANDAFHTVGAEHQRRQQVPPAAGSNDQRGKNGVRPRDNTHHGV